MAKQEGCVSLYGIFFLLFSFYIFTILICTFYIFWNLRSNILSKPHSSFTISFQLYLPWGQISLGLGHQELFHCSLFSKLCCYWLQLLFINLTLLLPVITESLVLPAHSSSTSTFPFPITIMAKSHNVWQNMLNIYGPSWLPLNPILKYFQVVWGQFCDLNNMLSPHFKRDSYALFPIPLMSHWYLHWSLLWSSRFLISLQCSL